MLLGRFALMESGDNSAASDTIASGSKRSFDDLEDGENDNSGSKKVCTKVEDAMLILSLQESLQKCKDALASYRAVCQNELESAKTELEAEKAEVNKWKSAFEKESFVPAGKSPEPGFVIDYIEKLRSSETTLNEQLEIAQMKLAIHDLKSQLKPAPIQEVEADEEDLSTSALLDELVAAKRVIVHLHEVQAVKLAGLEKTQAEHAKIIKNYINITKTVIDKNPKLVLPSAPENDAEQN